MGRLPETLAGFEKTAGSARVPWEDCRKRSRSLSVRSGLWISATFPVKQKANLAARLLPTNDLYVCRYMQNCFCTYTSTLYNKFFEIAPIFLIFSNSIFLSPAMPPRQGIGNGCSFRVYHYSAASTACQIADTTGPILTQTRIFHSLGHSLLPIYRLIGNLKAAFSPKQ